MKIGFNFLKSGLGNNGGTRTILRSAEVLESLGHSVELIATVDNFSWFGHKRISNKIPNDLDVIIATACTTVKSTLNARACKKAWYIRGHEKWAMNEAQLAACYKSGLINIVNSNWLKKKLDRYGVTSSVIYQGIDFDLWNDLNIRKDNKKIRVGCLYSKKPAKRWRDFQRIAQLLGTENYEYVAMGTTKCCDAFLTKSLTNPSTEELNTLYSSCDIWFAPTDNEGLHNVPMEAALCGCLIVCSSIESNGMVLDYAFKNVTAMVYSDLNEAVTLIKNPDWSLVKQMKETIREVIGSREKNMRKMIELFK